MDEIILIQKFCSEYDVPVSFIETLSEYELIKIENKQAIPVEQINTIEKMIRLHYDLDINFEGLHAIHNLLNQIEALQGEVRRLNNQLDFYNQFNLLSDEE